MITLTQKAATEFRKVVSAQEFPADTKLRVGVERIAEQEAGLRLCLAFETEPPSANDATHASEGVHVVLEKELAELLADAQIDFVQQGADQRGFVFRPGPGSPE